MQGYFQSRKIWPCSSHPQTYKIYLIFLGTTWPSVLHFPTSDRNMGTENDFPTLRMLRALKMGGAGEAIRTSKDCGKVESTHLSKGCSCHLLSIHCRQMGMQAQRGLVSEMSREAENPDFYVKFLNFKMLNKQNPLNGRKRTIGYHLITSVL